MKSLILIPLLVSLIPFTARAGSETGNGGDVVYCRAEDGGARVELLDFYEGRTLRAIAPDLGDPSLSAEAKVRLALSRLEKLSPRRHDRYAAWASAFLADTRFVSGSVLVDVPDSEIAVLPKGCEMRQVAIQKKPEFPEDRYYLVDRDLWDALDNDGRAGLMLHEILYREAIELGQTNSKSARYFNSILTSRKMAEFQGPEDFARFLEKLGYSTVEYDGLEYSEAHRDADGRVLWGEVIRGTIVWNGRAFPVAGPIQFYDNGSVSTLHLAATAEFPIQGNRLRFPKNGRVDFQLNGNLSMATLACDDGEPMRYGGADFELELQPCDGGLGGTLPTLIEFQPNGIPRALPTRGGWLRTPYGELRLGCSALAGSGRCEKTLLDASGRPVHVLLDGPQTYRIGQDAHIIRGPLALYEDGAVRTANTEDQFLVDGLPVRFDPAYAMFTDISFFPNGAVQMGQLRDDTILRQDSGTLRQYKARGTVEFNLAGRVVRGDAREGLVDDRISLQPVLLTLLTRTVEACGAELAVRLARQTFPGGCAVKTNALAKGSEGDLPVTWSQSLTCADAASGQDHRLTLEFGSPYSTAFRFAVDDAQLGLRDGLPTLRYRQVIPDSAIDLLGNVDPAQVQAAELIIRSPDNFGPAVPLVNLASGAPSKITVDMDAFRTCLMQPLFPTH
jgi:hypothetical protein